MREVLILAFRYPPFHEVGAYRWARFSGRLAREGHRVHVVTVAWPAVEEMSWFADTVHPNLEIVRTRSGYPHQLRWRRKERGRVRKEVRKRVLEAVNRFSRDDAERWGVFLLPKVADLVARHPIEVVVATGAPFNTNYWASEVKRKHPHLKLIQDFRDPWFTSNESLQSSPWRERFFAATGAADRIVAVTDEMSQLYAELAGHDRIATVPNGVDLEAVRAVRAVGPPELDFAYVGTLFNERDRTLALFLNWVRARAAQGRVVRGKIMGLYPDRLPGEFADLVDAGQLEFLPHGQQEKALRLVASARFGLQLSAPSKQSDTQVTTKIVEHAALGRPTLSLNYGGAVAKAIETRGLGISLDAGAKDLDVQLDLAYQSEQPWPLMVADLDFEHCARTYSELIETV